DFSTSQLMPARRRDCRCQAVNLTTQAESHNSICFGWRRWGAYLRRNDRTNSLTKRDSSPALMITDVSNHNDVSEGGLSTTPSAWRVRAVGFVRIATPTCSDTSSTACCGVMIS